MKKNVGKINKIDTNDNVMAVVKRGRCLREKR